MIWPFNRLFQNATLKEPEWWRQALFARPSASGQSVSTDSAMRISTVYACVRIISEAIAALPLRIYERTSTGKIATDHELNTVLQTPNDIQTGFELREFQVASLLLQGTAYVQKVRTQGGRIAQLVPLHTEHMNVDTNAAGELVFDYQERGNGRAFRKEDIWRITGLSRNGITGVSVINLARESIGLAMALEEHGATLFKNGTQTDAVYEMEGTLSDTAYDRLRKQMDEFKGSSRAWNSMILEHGLKRQAVAMTSEDSQFIETRKLQIADIARFFRVPLHMLNEMDNATFSNIEHQSIEFVRDTLTSWMVRIEASIYRDLLTPQERGPLFAKHSINALLRGASKERSDFYHQGILDGWLSRNEVRRYEDLNEVDGLDEFILPMNMGAANGAEARDAPAGSATVAALADSIIGDLVVREFKAIKADQGKSMEHFVDFYHRHLTRAADLLKVDKSLLVPYGQRRLEEIEKGISDDLLIQIAASAADELRSLTNA